MNNDFISYLTDIEEQQYLMQLNRWEYLAKMLIEDYSGMQIAYRKSFPAGNSFHAPGNLSYMKFLCDQAASHLNDPFHGGIFDAIPESLEKFMQNLDLLDEDDAATSKGKEFLAQYNGSLTDE